MSLDLSNPAEVLEKMENVREICRVGHELRAKAGIKIRQPLQSISTTYPDLGNEYTQLIKDELNIKEVIYV